MVQQVVTQTSIPSTVEGESVEPSSQEEPGEPIIQKLAESQKALENVSTTKGERVKELDSIAQRLAQMSETANKIMPQINTTIMQVLTPEITF